MKGPIAATAPSTELNSGSGNITECVVPVDILANPIYHIQVALEKKLRNLGKRTQKLRQIKLDQANGIKLSEEQREAISKAGEVELQAEFIKDLQKLVDQQLRQYQRAARQRGAANSKKIEKEGVTLLESALKYQHAISLLVNKEGMNCLGLSEEEARAFMKLHSSCFASTVSGVAKEWENHALCTAKKMKEIAEGTEKSVEGDLTGARAKFLLDQLMENAIIAQANKEDNDVIQPVQEDKKEDDEEERESDESSLDEFHRESVDSTVPNSDNKHEQHQQTNKEDEELEDNSSCLKNIKNGEENQKLVNCPEVADQLKTSAQDDGQGNEVKNETAAADTDSQPTKEASEKPRRSNNYHRYRRERYHQPQGKLESEKKTEALVENPAKSASNSQQPQQNRRPRHNNNYRNNNDTQWHRGSISDSTSSNTKPEKETQSKNARNGQTAQTNRPPNNRRHEYERGNEGERRTDREFRDDGAQRYNRGNNSEQYGRGGNGYYNRGNQPPQEKQRTHQPYECGLKFAY